MIEKFQRQSQRHSRYTVYKSPYCCYDLYDGPNKGFALFAVLNLHMNIYEQFMICDFMTPSFEGSVNMDVE